jgi:hypothetical protein
MSNCELLLLIYLGIFLALLVRWAWWLHPRCPQCGCLMNRSQLDEARAICPRCHLITRSM